MFSENNPDAAARVMLKETGPNTLEFRSPAKGLTLANLLRKDKEKEKTLKSAEAKPVQKTGIKPKKDTGALLPEPETFKIPEFKFSAPQFGTGNAPEMEDTKSASKTHKEAAAKKPEKSNAKEEKKAISGHKEKQEIIEVGAQGGKKKAGFRTALNRNKTELIAEKKWLEKELKNRKKTLNNLGQAKALFIRHYSMQLFPHNKGGSKGGVRKIVRLETVETPELSGQEFKLEKTESVLFMRKAKEHLNKEIGEIEADIKRIMKELEGLR